MSGNQGDHWHLELLATASTGPPEPYDIFHAAECFSKSALLLLVESFSPKHASHFIPAHVLALFSLELYLKCLHSIRGTMRPKMGHSPVGLFESLSKTDQLEITKKHETLVRLNVDPGFKKAVTASKAPMDAKSVLTRCDRLFEQYRYPYEAITLATTQKIDGSGPVAGVIGLTELVLALSAIILDCHPDWEQRLLADADKPYIRTPGTKPPKP